MSTSLKDMSEISSDPEVVDSNGLASDSVVMDKYPSQKDPQASKLTLISRWQENSPDRDYKEYINIFNFYNHVPFFKPLIEKLKTREFQVRLKRLFYLLAMILYSIYFIAVLLIPSKKEASDYWCDGDGFLIINTVFYASLLIYFQVMKPFFQKHLSRSLQQIYSKIAKRAAMRNLIMLKCALMIGSYIVFMLVDSWHDYSRLVSVLGIFILVAIGALFSEFPFKIRWNTVITGIWLQLAFGLLILRWSSGRQLFSCLGKKVTVLLSFTDAGTTFTYGSFLKTTDSYAFKILPVILFFGLIISVLYHFHIIQWMIIKLGWALQITMGTTPCESMATAANIFLGQSEAPLVIRPYVTVLTKSELHAVLTGGFATVAGGILAAYISFGAAPSHLLSASIMSAPAALAMSKLFFPETEDSVTTSETIKIMTQKRKNLIHSIMDDLIANIPLIANITAVLIVILAGTTFINAVTDWGCQLLDVEEGVCSVEAFLGLLLYPFSFLMGVPRADRFAISRLLGIKVFISDFLAFKELGQFLEEGLVSPRAAVIATYALCGFSSVASMGAQLGSLGCMAPSRVQDIASVLFRSFVAGNFACLLTACVAGTLIHDPSTKFATTTNGTFLN